MDIRQMNRTHLEHWRGLRNSSGLVTRMTPIWRTAKKFCKPIIWHHLLRWQTGWRLALRMPQSATIMSMAVTVRPWFSLKVFLFSPHSVNAA